MAVDEVASSLSFEINICYLDAKIGSLAMSAFAGVHECITELKQIGLEVNPSTCEIINMSYPIDESTQLATTLASGVSGLRGLTVPIW